MSLFYYRLESKEIQLYYEILFAPIPRPCPRRAIFSSPGMFRLGAGRLPCLLATILKRSEQKKQNKMRKTKKKLHITFSTLKELSRDKEEKIPHKHFH